MICYLDSCRDKVLKLCTPQKFTELTESQRTAMLIDAFRSGENPDAKSQLPAFVFMGYDPKMLEIQNDRNTEIQKTGSRKKSDLKPTGLVMFDFDHLKEEYNLTPYEAYDRFLKILPKLGLTLERNLALAHNTCSNNGLRTVIFLQNGKTIAQIQEQVSKLLGIECDKAVKDISRLSFCPKAEDILYLNKNLLFGEIQNPRNTEIQKYRITEIQNPRNTEIQNNNENNGNNSTENDATRANSGAGEGRTEVAVCHEGCELATDLQSGGTLPTADGGTEQHPSTAQPSEKHGGSNEGGMAEESVSEAQDSSFKIQVSSSKMQDSSSADNDLKPETMEPETMKPETSEAETLKPETEVGRPTLYHGVPYASIVEKWIELRGGKPEPGDRHATLVELAMDLRKICDNDKEWIASLMPDFDKGEQEKRDCIEWAVGRQHSKLSGTLLDALAALGIARNTEIQKYRNTEPAGFRIQDSSFSASADSSLFTLHSSLSEQSEDLPPALPEELPSLVRLMTSKVLDHQKPAVASMMFPALATHVNNCLFKLRDNTDVELSLMCCLLATQSAGKGCVKAPLRLIMSDIKAEDKINRQRERDWQESQKNKKANEKGASRPTDIVIRILSADTTPAAFLGRLLAAETGDGLSPNLCTYSQVDEIEDLYRFCSSGGRNMVQQMIKRTWDRDDIGAERWSANSANISTVLRWNWAASSTIEGGKKFFKNCLTDGTTSRVDFCTIIPPSKVIDFCYGDYDDEFEDALKPYIDHLKAFACQKTESGKVIPVQFPEILAVENAMNSYINDTASTMPDETWVNYAWRAKVMSIKKLIVLYIANGCRWESSFEPFAWWAFHYNMWCKMNLFYDAASAAFQDERIRGDKGHKSPLKFMKREFTFADFAQVCQHQGVKQKPEAILRKYKSRGVIVIRDDNTYLIEPEYAKKFGLV